MNRTRNLMAWAALAAVVALPLAASALEKEYVAPPAPKADDQPGWHGSLRVGANLNFTNNRKVVGQLDGNQFQFGGTFDGDLGYRLGEHDWRNNLGLLETFSYGPPVKALVKTADTLKFETAYFYHPIKVPWIGPFVRGSATTALFEGTDNRAAPTDYVITNEIDGQTGNPRQVLQTKRLRLSESFRPSTLRESAGLFMNPYSKDFLDIMILVGGGSTQVFADGQYALKDDAKTPVVELNRLSTYQQVGLEAGLALTGIAYAGKIKYKAYTDVLVPFWRSDKKPGDKRSLGDLTNVEVGGMLSFKLVDWASVDYVLKAMRQPQLAQDWQLQNMLMLTFGYSYSKRQIPAPAPAAK